MFSYAALFHWTMITGRLNFLAILWTLAWSSAYHLIPYESCSVEQFVARMDKIGIVAITISNTMMLTQSEILAPITQTASVAGMVLSVFLVVKDGVSLSGYEFSAVVPTAALIPVNIIIACGLRSLRMRVYFTTVLLYVAGLGCHCIQRPGRYARLWGYHEWMHLGVTSAMVLNVLFWQIELTSDPL